MPEALARVEGDAELLGELAAIFLQNYPAMVDQVRASIGDGDGESLRRSAHLLKGSIGNFMAKNAYDAASTLEQIGEKGNLSDAGAAFESLTGALAALEEALDGLAADSTA